MGRKSEITVNFQGEKLSLKEVFEKYQNKNNPITKAHFYNRVRAGWTIDDAINTPIGRRLTKWKYKGQWLSIRQIWENNPHHPSINLRLFRNRLHQGWNVEEALNTYTIPKDSKGIQKYHYKGELLTLREIHEKYQPDIPVGRVRSRLSIGWTIEKAVETPLQSRGERNKKYKYKGELLTLKEIHEKYQPDISLQCFRERIYKDWTIKKALTIPKSKHQSNYDETWAN